MDVPFGIRYHSWTVIGAGDHVVDKRGDKVYRWLCRCDCGGTHKVFAHVLRNNRSRQCRACKYATSHPRDVFFYNRFKRGAAVRGLPWHLTLAQFTDSFHAQGGRCALTGTQLFWPSGTRDIGGPACTASLDRKRHADGYTTDNIQWVHKYVNMLKGNRSDADLLHWARLIVAHADTRTP